MRPGVSAAFMLRTRLRRSILPALTSASLLQAGALTFALRIALPGALRAPLARVWAWTDLLHAELSQESEPSIALAGYGTAHAEETADSSPLAWDGLLLAAPKKKVSHSRKAMRRANKGLKDRVSALLIFGC